MSISLAPFFIASSVSKTFTSFVLAPSGKPITVQTLTSVPFKLSAHFLTHTGFTQTEKKLYSLASSKIFSICSSVDSGFNKVWSIILLISISLSPMK